MSAAAPEVQLVAIDLDGTLLDPQGDIPQRNIRALEGCIELGVRVVVCTGRGRFTAAPLLERIPRNAEAVLQGGALVVGERIEEVVEFRNLDVDAAIAAVAIIERHGAPAVVFESLPQGYRFFYRQDGAENVAFRAYLEGNPMRRIAVSAWDIDDPPALVATVAPTSLIRRLHRKLESALGDRATVIPEANYIHPQFSQLYAFPPGASKGAALTRVCRRLGVPLGAIMAVGDNHNDLDMLQTAAIAVAMENATPEVREVADWIAPSFAEAGVAAAIEKYVLAPRQTAV